MQICLINADIHSCEPLTLTTIQLLKEWIILSSQISHQRKILPPRQRSVWAFNFLFSPGMSHHIASYFLLFNTPVLLRSHGSCTVDTHQSLTSKYATQTEHRDWLTVTRHVLLKTKFRKIKPWTHQPSFMSIQLRELTRFSSF